MRTDGRSASAQARVGGYRGWWERCEAALSWLSVRNVFWMRLCSRIWLPYAFYSGVRIESANAETFSAVLPFRRFNRNWHKTMAGSALLGNTEIAAGLYIFSVCGAKCTIVCKSLNYRFLRPCVGSAIFRITPQQDMRLLLETQHEFNIDLKVDIVQLPAVERTRDN